MLHQNLLACINLIPIGLQKRDVNPRDIQKCHGCGYKRVTTQIPSERKELSRHETGAVAPASSKRKEI